MIEYHKIPTVWMRDPETDFRTLIPNTYATPVLEYLADLEWEFTEKVDGTNIRVMFDDFGKASFGGRTSNAQLHQNLVQWLMDKFNDRWPQFANMTLYGEGYGPKIQSGGKYRGDIAAVFYDVLAGKWWLRRSDVEDVCSTLGVDDIPTIGRGTLTDMVKLVKKGVRSRWGNFPAEGLVARPIVGLFDRGGKRIIAKLKHRDFGERS